MNRQTVLDSIVVSIPACHAGDRGSIPRRGGILFTVYFVLLFIITSNISYDYFNEVNI